MQRLSRSQIQLGSKIDRSRNQGSPSLPLKESDMLSSRLQESRYSTSFNVQTTPRLRTLFRSRSPRDLISSAESQEGLPPPIGSREGSRSGTSSRLLPGSLGISHSRTPLRSSPGSQGGSRSGTLSLLSTGFRGASHSRTPSRSLSGSRGGLHSPLGSRKGSRWGTASRMPPGSRGASHSRTPSCSPPGSRGSSYSRTPSRSSSESRGGSYSRTASRSPLRSRGGSHSDLRRVRHQGLEEVRAHLQGLEKVRLEKRRRVCHQALEVPHQVRNSLVLAFQQEGDGQDPVLGQKDQNSKETKVISKFLEIDVQVRVLGQKDEHLQVTKLVPKFLEVVGVKFFFSVSNNKIIRYKNR